MFLRDFITIADGIGKPVNQLYTVQYMPPKLTAAIQKKSFNTLSSLVLITAYLVFLFNHVVALKAGAISGAIVVFIVMETIVILLLLLRTIPRERSTNPLAWIYALGGTFFPLLLLPGTTFAYVTGNTLMITGGLLAILAYLSLNRSFGIAPALRNIKTNGLYKIVRHPMYSSYFIIYSGYLLLSFSLYNLILIAVLFFILFQRAKYEELLLSQDSGYVSYTKQIRYRFFPGLF